MAFDERLAERLRTLTRRTKGFAEKKLFGGLGLLLRGHMCLGIWKDSLIARVGPEQYRPALAESCVAEFDITGRPMTGWVLVRPEAIADDADLQVWIDRAVGFVATLPPK